MTNVKRMKRIRRMLRIAIFGLRGKIWVAEPAIRWGHPW